MPHKDQTVANEYARRWRAKNRESSRVYHRQLYAKNRDARISYRMNRKYGVTLEEYAAMLAAQGGGCAICGAKQKKRRLAVDHDHETGEVRGLLCSPCNTGLGQFKDKAALLARAIDYLLTNRKD